MRWLTITAAMAALAMVGLQSPQAPVALERPETIRSIAPLTYDGRVGCTVFSINGNGTWASAYHCIVGLPDLALLRIEDLPAVPLVAFPGDDLIALKTAFGAPALRLAAEAPEADASPRQAPRAHIRRAHWHTYWVGEGSRIDPSKAQVRVRWLPPIPVGLPDALIPTIRPVT